MDFKMGVAATLPELSEWTLPSAHSASSLEVAIYSSSLHSSVSDWRVTSSSTSSNPKRGFFLSPSLNLVDELDDKTSWSFLLIAQSSISVFFSSGRLVLYLYSY